MNSRSVAILSVLGLVSVWVIPPCALAQTLGSSSPVAIPDSPAAREASFAPLQPTPVQVAPSPAAPAPVSPVAAPPATTPPATASSAATPASDNHPVLISPPSLAVSPATGTSTNTPTQPSVDTATLPAIGSAVVAIPLTTPAAPAATSAPAPVAAFSAAAPVGSATPTISAGTSAAAPTDPAVIIGPPVSATPLANIDPDSVGLLASTASGLGANVWKGTSYVMAARLMASLNLPTLSATLNRLAQKLLLTTASPPEGANAQTANLTQSLTAIRIDRLVALGDAADAWKLTMAAKPELIDELTWQRVTENVLLSNQGDDVCTRLAGIMTTHTQLEWQKILMVCQLRAKDIKAAQVTLDLLHAQSVKDDIFMALVEKNLVGGAKQLPRQLTPLKPLNMALLRLIELPLPNEVYARPDAALIPALLEAKPKDDMARLTLAERAAERNLINSTALADIYRNVSFTGEQITGVLASGETGPRLHALLYQAMLIEKMPQRQIDEAIKFMQSANPALLMATASLLADMVSGIKPSADYYPYATAMAELTMLAGKADAVQEWLALAKRGAIGMPSVAAALQTLWPVRVFSGYESDTDYAEGLKGWLDATVKPSDTPSGNKAMRDQTVTILSLLEAMGFAVPDEAWLKVLDAPSFDKRAAPPAWLIERLHAAAAANRRGEVILLALLMNNNGQPDLSHFVSIDTVRSLRINGLTADAASLATETALDTLQATAP